MPNHSVLRGRRRSAWRVLAAVAAIGLSTGVIGPAANATPAPMAQIADNGNGTMTLTYEVPDGVDVYGTLVLLSPEAACSLDVFDSLVGPDLRYFITSDLGYTLPPSPAVIGPGSPALDLELPGYDISSVVIEPGEYQACLYFPGDIITQSLAVSLVEAPTPPTPPTPPQPPVTPTTQPEPTVVPDTAVPVEAVMVAPRFTG